MRQLAAFDMLLNYAQIAIHRPDQPEFFEDWTPEDVAHGMMARDGHVVFGVDDHDGLAAVTVWLADAPSQEPEQVTITVGQDGLILATPLGDDHRLAVPAGRYALEFEQRFDGDDRLHARLVFSPV